MMASSIKLDRIDVFLVTVYFYLVYLQVVGEFLKLPVEREIAGFFYREYILNIVISGKIPYQRDKMTQVVPVEVIC